MTGETPHHFKIYYWRVISTESCAFLSLMKHIHVKWDSLSLAEFLLSANDESYVDVSAISHTARQGGLSSSHSTHSGGRGWS